MTEVEKEEEEEEFEAGLTEVEEKVAEEQEEEDDEVGFFSSNTCPPPEGARAPEAWDEDGSGEARGSSSAKSFSDAESSSASSMSESLLSDGSGCWVSFCTDSSSRQDGLIVVGAGRLLRRLRAGFAAGCVCTQRREIDI